MGGRERSADGRHGRQRPQRVVALVSLLWAPRLLLLSMFCRVIMLLLLLLVSALHLLLLLVAFPFSLV